MKCNTDSNKNHLSESLFKGVQLKGQSGWLPSEQFFSFPLIHT